MLLPGACGVLFTIATPNWLATASIFIGILGVILLAKAINWNGKE